MNEGLLEAESAVFSIGFCKPAVKKRMKKYTSLQRCVRRKATCTIVLQDHCNRGANSWETSALTSAHMVLCLESEEHFKKKGRTVKTDREFLDMLLSSHRDEKQCARSA